MQGAELLVDDGARPGRGRLEIEPVILHHLADAAGPGVVREQRDRPGAVREEVDGVADPHRRHVVRVLARDLLDAPVTHPCDPDGRGEPAPIMLPDLECRPVGVVRERPAVRGEAAIETARQVQLLGKATVRRDGVEPVVIVRDARARRAEENAAAGGPSHHLVVVGVVGQPLRHAPGRGHHVHVRVPLVLAGEGYHRSVGGEARPILLARAGREAARLAPLARHGPQVSSVAEHDLGAADRRGSEEERGIGVGFGKREENDQESEVSTLNHEASQKGAAMRSPCSGEVRGRAKAFSPGRNAAERAP